MVNKPSLPIVAVKGPLKLKTADRTSGGDRHHSIVDGDSDAGT